MKVVVEGCCHGELEKIYDVIGQLQEREGVSVDLLICCGDFQAVRNEDDLQSMAVPPKYREMGSFYKYYSGEKMAPVLTIFIGGNHEASNHLWELSYGGWVAPRIYYLGRAGVVQFGGLRIAGLSGIYKEGDYRKGCFERPPFSESTKRSVYHVRSCDVFRLKQVSSRVDIGLSHDWPQGIYHHGNKAQLLRKKPYFSDEMEGGTLGNPAAMELLQHLRPDYWFSAHLHVKFAAVYHHGNEAEGCKFTKFLALDKCLPGRRYLQVLDIPAPCSPPYKLCYDSEWLAILRSTNHLMSPSHSLWLPPHPSTDTRVRFTPDSSELKEVETLFGSDLTIPAPPLTHPQPHEDTQTTIFCNTLRITNHFTTHRLRPQLTAGTLSADITSNPDEIDLGDLDDSDEGEEQRCHDVSSSEPQDSATVPGKRHYPWLDDTSGDELNPLSPGQTGSGVVAMATEDSLNRGQKSLEPTGGSHDSGGENPDEIVLDEGSEEEGVAGVNIDPGSKVTTTNRPVIKRRNVAIYGTNDDDDC